MHPPEPNPTPGYDYPAPSGQVPTAQNIDPYASASPPTTTTTTTTTPTTPTSPTAPGTSMPRPDPLAGIGNSQVDAITAAQRQALADANVQVTSIYNELQDTKAKYDAILASGDTTAINQQGAQLSNQLNGLYTRLAGAQQNLSTANTAYATAVTDALKSVQVDPQQAAALQAQAQKSTSDATLEDAQAKVLLDGADTQKQKSAADAALASNQALLSKAQADALSAKTPQDIATAKAQADLYGAQSNQIQQLLPGLVQKQAADTSLTVAQAGLTSSQSDLAQAQTAQASANTNLINVQAAQLTPAQAAAQLGQASVANAQATGLIPAQTAAQLADIQKGQLGPVYGLQQQIDAIRQIQQQVFGPGGSGNPQDANDLLSQYTQATIGGTTPYAANVAAANYGQNIFGTQASMYNAAQSALATRANALAGLGGNVLSTLGSMNANAPAGSTALAGAFRDVMNYTAAQQQAAQDSFARQMGFSQGPGGLQQPTAPALPAFLQRLTGVTGTGAPAPAAALPPPGAPSPQASAPGQAPVTITIGGGQTQPAAPAQTTPAVTTPAQTTPPWTPASSNYSLPGPAPWNAQPGSSIPSMLQKYVPLTPDQAADYWHQINGVPSPYQQAA